MTIEAQAVRMYAGDIREVFRNPVAMIVALIGTILMAGLISMIAILLGQDCVVVFNDAWEAQGRERFRDEFLEAFNAQNTRVLTQAHVYRSRQLGVMGFPTLLLSHADRHVLLSNGYCEAEPLCQAIDNYLIIFAESDAEG